MARPVSSWVVVRWWWSEGGGQALTWRWVVVNVRRPVGEEENGSRNFTPT